MDKPNTEIEAGALHHVPFIIQERQRLFRLDKQNLT